MSKEGKKIGRPTKYHEDMPQLLIDFFNRPLKFMKRVQQATAKGVVELDVEEFCDPPFIESFCAEHLISKDTFYAWVKKYPDFSDAFKAIKPIQAKVLLIGSMKGHYNSSISKLVLANCTDYKEQKEDKEVTEIKVELVDERAKRL